MLQAIRYSNAHSRHASLAILERLALTACLTVVSLLPANGQVLQQRVLSVCAVLANKKQYQNQVVVVRGQLRAGRHGADLVGDNCQDSNEKQQVPGIWITTTGDIGAPQVQFRGDIESLTAVVSFQRSLGEVGRPFRNVVVLEGKLFTDDERGGVGFGHLNAYSIALVVRKVLQHAVYFDEKENQ